MSASNKDCVGTVTVQRYTADGFALSPLHATASLAGLSANGNAQRLTGQIVYYPVQSAGHKNPRIDIPPDPGV